MLLKNKIKFIVIHCSDTPDSENWEAIDIHKMHIGFGWDGIGYHKIINKNGLVENGRPEYWIGAHVKGKNVCSLGVCLIGRNNFNNKQYNSLINILKSWKTKYPRAKIIGHNELTDTDKTCPNFNVQSWLKRNNLK